MKTPADELLYAALRDNRGLSADALERITAEYLGVETGPVRFLDQPTGNARARRSKVEIPAPLLQEVETLARGEGTTAAELVRRFVNLGLYLARAQGAPGTALILRDEERERELILL